MENEVSIFENKEFGKVRTVDEDGKILFAASDIANALGYSNTNDAISRHCKGVVKHDTLTNGGKQQINFIPEGDVYRLIAHSKLPSAERFESWVFDEVLPCIRKNGAYVTKSKLHEILDDPTAVVRLCQQIVDFQKELTEQKKENEGLKVELDKSKEWYSIKRVGIMNGVTSKQIPWPPLKRESLKRGYEIKKTYDQNYGSVNAYHLDIWKAVYPQYKY